MLVKNMKMTNIIFEIYFQSFNFLLRKIKYFLHAVLCTIKKRLLFLLGRLVLQNFGQNKVGDYYSPWLHSIYIK